MQTANVPFEKLKAVNLTYQDIDHIGNLSEILQAADWQIDVYAHEVKTEVQNIVVNHNN